MTWARDPCFSVRNNPLLEKKDAIYDGGRNNAAEARSVGSERLHGFICPDNQSPLIRGM